MNKISSKYNLILRDEIIRLLINSGVVEESFTTLEDIHNNVLDESLLDYEFNSGVNGITERLYEVDDMFLAVYYRLLKDLYHNHFKFDFYFQDTPTIRVHCPNTKNQNHYPRYHTDMQYGHPPEEINLWMSLTKNNNSGFSVVDIDDSTDWIREYNWDWEEFTKQAIESKAFNDYGDDLSDEVGSSINSIYIFDVQCIHSNQVRTEDSRVSVDFRINPVDKFVDGYVGSGRMKAEFKPGGKFGYYEKSIKELEADWL